MIFKTSAPIKLNWSIKECKISELHFEGGKELIGHSNIKGKFDQISPFQFEGVMEHTLDTKGLTGNNPAACRDHQLKDRYPVKQWGTLWAWSAVWISWELLPFGLVLGYEINKTNICCFF